MSRQAGSRASRNSETDEDNDSQHYPYPYGYPAREIKKNALNFHRDSVNLIGLVRNVTLVPSVVHVGSVTWP